MSASALRVGGRDLDILVFGGDAIGSLLAYRLAAAGHCVTAVGRAAYARAVNQRGLLVETGRRVICSPPFRAVDNVEVLHDARFDLILITTRAFDTAVAAVQAQPFAQREATVVVLQNGVGGIDVAIGLLGPKGLYAGVTTIPVDVLKPAVIRVLESKGGIGVAPVDVAQDTAPVVQLLAQAGFETRAYGDWQAMQWSKLLLSMLANAVPAILDWSLEQILASRKLYELERDALCEARAVIRKLQVRLVSLPGYPVPLLAYGMCLLPSAVAHPIFRRVILQRRGNKPSPLQVDLAKGSRQSEVTFLNGAVSRIAAQVGVRAPINWTLDKIIVGIARGEIEWSEYRGQAERLIRRVRAGRVGSTNW
jgi:2-dehydropantoate 2-reductase